MATLIRTDGTTTEVRPERPAEGFKLAQLYALLGCDMIEIVRLGDGYIMVIDEEGKCKDPIVVNPAATYFAKDVAQAIAPDDCIVGHALVCRDSEVK